jgi:hypothetical protein
LRTLVDATRFTTSAGVAGALAATRESGWDSELAPAAGGVDSRLMPPRLGDGDAENGEGA